MPAGLASANVARRATAAAAPEKYDNVILALCGCYHGNRFDSECLDALLLMLLAFRAIHRRPKEVQQEAN